MCVCRECLDQLAADQAEEQELAEKEEMERADEARFYPEPAGPSCPWGCYPSSDCWGCDHAPPAKG